MCSFALRKDFVQKSPDTVKGFMKAYYDTLTFMSANQTESLKIIGDAVGENADDVMADLGTLQLFDLAKGEEVMGTAGSPGKISDNVKAAADFLQTQGQIDTTADPKDDVHA